jgi:hypothetical protein
MAAQASSRDRRALMLAYCRVVWAGRFVLETRRRWPKDARERIADIDEQDVIVQDELRRRRA